MESSSDIDYTALFRDQLAIVMGFLEQVGYQPQMRAIRSTRFFAFFPYITYNKYNQETMLYYNE